VGGGYSVSVKDLLWWLIFNQPVIIAGQMWFLFALLYDYILFAVAEKLKLYKISAVAIPVGVCVYIILAQGLHLAGIAVPNMVYRNFLIEGFPLFSLGYWIHRKQADIKISNRVLLIILIASTVLCPVERILMGRDFGVNIVTFPQVISLFLLCVNNPERFSEKKLTSMGLKYSMFVYILHPAVWHTLEFLYRRIGISEVVAAQYIMPILCVIGTLIVSAIVYKLKNQLKRKAT
jgi:hypothetical protein